MNLKPINEQMKENQGFLEELLGAPSPTGYENAAVEAFNSHMSEFSQHVFTDKFQNSVFKKVLSMVLLFYYQVTTTNLVS